MKGYFRLFCLLAFFTLSVVYPTSSQVLSFYINGKITDKESNKPIHLAELFISGSSIGTATDEKGNFKISIPLLPCYLVVTHRDYDPFATYIENFMDSIHIESFIYQSGRLYKIKQQRTKKRSSFFLPAVYWRRPAYIV